MRCELLDDLRHHDSVLWRRAVGAGVTYGPDAWVRLQPAALRASRSRRRSPANAARGARQPPPRARPARPPSRGVGRGPRSSPTTPRRSPTPSSRAASGATRSQVRCLDEPTLRAARDEGRGIILATAHTGGWQVAGRAFERLLDAEMLIVMRRERDRGRRRCKRRRGARGRALRLRGRRPARGARRPRSPSPARRRGDAGGPPPARHARPPGRAVRRAVSCARGASAPRGCERGPHGRPFSRAASATWTTTSRWRRPSACPAAPRRPTSTPRPPRFSAPWKRSCEQTPTQWFHFE